MIEAGLLNDDWWRKLDQGLMFVPGLKMFTKPFLFAVLTMDVNRDDPNSISRGRMGAFLIAPLSEGDTPRHVAGFRMTLLRRDETAALKQFSEHFGRESVAPRAFCQSGTQRLRPTTPLARAVAGSEQARCVVDVVRAFSRRRRRLCPPTQPSMFYPPSPSPTTASHRSSSAGRVGGPPSVRQPLHAHGPSAGPVP
jgi:hypothetical protein